MQKSGVKRQQILVRGLEKSRRLTSAFTKLIRCDRVADLERADGQSPDRSRQADNAHLVNRSSALASIRLTPPLQRSYQRRHAEIGGQASTNPRSWAGEEPSPHVRVHEADPV